MTFWVSHANVVSLTVLSPLITMSTKQSAWWPFGFTRKCRHSDCIVATYHIVNKAVRLMTFRFHTQMSSLWLYYRHLSQCQQSSQLDDLSVSHANVVTLTVLSPLITMSTKQSGWWPFGFIRKCRHSDCIIATHHIVNKAVRLMNFRFHMQMSSFWLYYRHSSHCQQSSQADELSVSHANVVILTLLSPLITLSTKQSGWWTFGFTRKCRHSDFIIATHHIVNKAVRLMTFRFHTQMSSVWLYYRHLSQCQQSSQLDDLSVSHANVVILTVLSPLITLSTKQSGWWPFGFTRKCRHSDCIIATYHNVNKAVSLMTFRFHTQMSSFWLYYRHSSHCQQSSQADDLSVSHANVVTLTVLSPLITMSTKQSAWWPFRFIRKCRHSDCIIATHHIVNNVVRLMTFSDLHANIITLTALPSLYPLSTKLSAWRPSGFTRKLRHTLLSLYPLSTKQSLWLPFRFTRKRHHSDCIIVKARLTHWGRDKMPGISQTTFSYAFLWKKMFKFLSKFH